MPTLYRNESSYPKNNAQRNLQGRTHYVDDDTLRGFHSCIISARETDGGLLFAIVTSDAKDFENKSRGFRYVIFDLFGTVVERNPSSTDREYFRTSDQATKAMWKALDAIDAVEVNRKAALSARKSFELELVRVEASIKEVIKAGKVKGYSEKVA